MSVPVSLVTVRRMAWRVGSAGVTWTVIGCPASASSGTSTRRAIGLAALMMMPGAVRMPSISSRAAGLRCRLPCLSGTRRRVLLSIGTSARQAATIGTVASPARSWSW